MKEKVRFEVELSSAQALALAQFLKRVTWSEIRSCSVNDEECYSIRDSLEAVQQPLNMAGYNPR